MTEERITITEARETVKKYKKEFSRAGIDAFDLLTLQDNFIITEHETKKRNGKPYEVTERTVSAREYMCTLTWIRFFHARVTRNYSEAGNVIYKMTYVSPDKKESRTIRYTYKYKG